MYGSANQWGKEEIFKNYVVSLFMWKNQLVYLSHDTTNLYQVELNRKGKLKLKSLVENIEWLYELAIGKDYLRKQKVHTIKKMNNKYNSVKMKNFISMQEHLRKRLQIRRQLLQRKKMERILYAEHMKYPSSQS